jgi:flagellar basal-body rod modification protein FlgD
MAISSVTDTSSTLSSYTSSTSGNNTLGEEDFLSLLVAQLEHQDPLDPQDNTEFIAQLAQFSSLEAQTATNDKLDALLAAQSSSEQTAAFSLLGQQVIVASDSLYLQGDSVELGVSLDQSAVAANIDILDDEGTTVASFTLDELQEGYNFINWDGSDSAGNQLPSGVYSMEIEVKDAAGEAIETQPLIKVEVEEVALDSSGSILVTDAGNIPLSGVTSVMAQ